MEGLRVNPGITAHMAQTVLGQELVHGNQMIPAGKQVAMATDPIDIDERLYPDPERCNQEK